VALEFRRGAQLPETERAQVFEQHRARLDEVLEVIDRALKGREVLVGGSFTAADLLSREGPPRDLGRKRKPRLA
jgi:glutathione S-transferase